MRKFNSSKWNPRRSAGMLWAAAVGCVILLCHNGHAAEAQSPAGKYCGLYAIYAAARLEGMRLDFRKLLDAKYIGSANGSSLAELERAAHDVGLHTATFARLNASDLAHTQVPLLLHAKTEVRAGSYDHWVLFVRADGDGNVHVVDGELGFVSMPIGILMDRWDGAAMACAAHPIDRNLAYRGQLRKVAPLACVPLLGAAGIACSPLRGRARSARADGRARRASPALATNIGGFTVITVGGAILGTLLQAAVVDGVLGHNGASVAAIQQTRFDNFLRKLDTDDIRRLVASGDAILVDARLRIDFERGHLPGAVNIPVTTPPGDYPQVLNRLGEVPKSRFLAVYCESRQCPYSRIVALNLHDLGYTSLALFEDGWVGWKAHAGNVGNAAIK